jgi:hypothetical protein
MAELFIYPTYREFHDKIVHGRNEDYSLTSKIPLGITVCIGEVSRPEKEGWRKFLPYKEERNVVCVGAMSNGRHLFAVKKSWLESGGKLSDF